MGDPPLLAFPLPASGPFNLNFGTNAAGQSFDIDLLSVTTSISEPAAQALLPGIAFASLHRSSLRHR